MSNDRHSPDIARTMASAAATDPLPKDTHHADEHAVTDERPSAIFAGAEAAGYRTQWDAIQTGFVDEPRKAVQEADALVSLVTKRLAEVFTDERNALEHQWDRGDEISTEDLRLALRKYHAFFERLLRL